uniref:Immunoglobulin V-set domain-containing protein n=1 Tax=Anolis carolinensis TaxID=28377 RepID=A0A803U0C1_ANOCA
MKSTIGIAVLLTVLEFACCQRIKKLKACLDKQSLRIDCNYERKTKNALTYEFRLSKDNTEGVVVAGNWNTASSIYKSRTNHTADDNLVCLYLHGFTTADEGIYICKLKITNDYGPQAKNITVIKGEGILRGHWVPSRCFQLWAILPQGLLRTAFLRGCENNPQNSPK